MTILFDFELGPSSLGYYSYSLFHEIPNDPAVHLPPLSLVISNAPGGGITPNGYSA